MIFECPKCNSKFQSNVSGIVICPACNASVEVNVPGCGEFTWECARQGNFISSFIQTLKFSLRAPQAFFGEMGAGAGWMRPFIYALIVSCIGFATAIMYQAGFQALATMFNVGGNWGADLGIAALSLPIFVMVMLVFVIFFVPVATFCCLFIQAGICHLCLMILGAASRDFYSTFRVVCYSYGPYIFQVIPLIGGIVGPVWSLMLVIIGLKTVHQTTYGRAALAVFLPLLLCCLGAVLVFTTILGGVAAGLIKSWG